MENETVGSMLDFDKINDKEGLDQIKEWFTENKIGSLWNDKLASQFTKVGNLSENAQSLISFVDAQSPIPTDTTNGADFKNSTKLFLNSVNELLSSGLNISGLQNIPAQDAKYALMKGDVRRTTKSGYRVKTPDLPAGVLGTTYSFGLKFHDSEDCGSSNHSYFNPASSEISLGFTTVLGLQLNMDFGGGNSLQNNHTDSDTIMQLLNAMLTSGSSTKIKAGLLVGTMGKTGTGANVVHDHLAAKYGGKTVDASEFFKLFEMPQLYRDKGVILTGYASNADSEYASTRMLAEVKEFAATEPKFKLFDFFKAHYNVLGPEKSNGKITAFNPTSWQREEYTTKGFYGYLVTNKLPSPQWFIHDYVANQYKAPYERYQAHW